MPRVLYAVGKSVLMNSESSMASVGWVLGSSATGMDRYLLQAAAAKGKTWCSRGIARSGLSCNFVRSCGMCEFIGYCQLLPIAPSCQLCCP